MASGGARARSGPPPDPNALRRNRPQDAAQWTVLPAEGYDGPMPPWPLSTPTEREHELWERLWTKPQALMWARDQLDYEVAAYVRCLARAEMPKGSALMWSEQRQRAESLGLSVSGMARNRWKVADTEGDSVTAHSEAPPQATRRPSARDRMMVIDGGR